MTGIILAHPRSGSTELVRALREATGAKFTMEPFHPPKMKRKGIDFDGPGLRSYMDGVMERSAAIKHIWTGLSVAQNASVLSHPSVSTVVFLYREDALAAALSRVVANMTGQWDRGDRATLGPLPLEKIEKQCRMIQRGQQRYRKWLAQSPIPHLSISYECLYGGMAEQFLVAVCGLLNLRPPRLEAALNLLSPDNRYNSEQFYQSAPNWQDFKIRFGR